MEDTFKRVGEEIEDFDSHSVSSLTTVPISNRSKITPDISRTMTKIPHNQDETDVNTIDTDPTHTLGSGHQSVFSDITGSDVDELDEDLREEVRQAEQAAREAAREARQQAKTKQRKRRLEKAMRNEHEDAKNDNKKHRDDENGDEGGNCDSKRPAVAAAPAPVGVSTK